MKRLILTPDEAAKVRDGRKTQGRVLMRRQPTDWPSSERGAAAPHMKRKHEAPYFDAYNGGPFWCWWDEWDRQGPDWVQCPWKVGDKLWVAEAWRTDRCYDHLSPKNLPHGVPIYFEADANPRAFVAGWDRVRLPVHMPRGLSRTTLQITAIRAEQVREITPEGCRAEGGTKSVIAFRHRWDSRHPGSWERNDWVWVRTWERVEENNARK